MNLEISNSKLLNLCQHSFNKETIFDSNRNVEIILHDIIKVINKENNREEIILYNSRAVLVETKDKNIDDCELLLPENVEEIVVNGKFLGFANITTLRKVISLEEEPLRYKGYVPSFKTIIIAALMTRYVIGLIYTLSFVGMKSLIQKDITTITEYIADCIYVFVDHARYGPIESRHLTYSYFENKNNPQIHVYEEK